MAPNSVRSSRGGVALLTGALLILGSSTAWAHGEAASPWTTPGQASLRVFVFVALLAAFIRVVLHPDFRSRLQGLRPRIGPAVSCAVIGVLSLYLIILPPHLVHHLAGAQDEGQQCSLFVHGNIPEHARAEPAPLVEAPSMDGTVATHPALPALSRLIPTPSGRSPPGRWI